ncbi:MAG: RloB family protein [Kiritimatiellia bacterium]
MSNAFNRSFAKRRYKRLFVISCEGYCTEPEYFEYLQQLNPAACLKIVKKEKGSAPQKVLERAKRAIKSGTFGVRSGDEVWCVLDRDCWSEKDLREVETWANAHSKDGITRGCALSNPKFELWLLLHFEDTSLQLTVTQCDKKLKRWMPHYKKHLTAPKSFSRELIENAIARAEKAETGQSLLQSQGTNVHRLVKSFLSIREREPK